jgi:peptidoglycan hydrolase-like protein with peptidoglycan-binding domain
MSKILRRASLGLLAGVVAMATLAATGAAGAATTARAAPAAHTTAAPLKWPTTGPGSTGERVVAIQYLLNQQINAKLTVDGIYGTKTTAAVKAFQKKVKIPSDGIVGPMTYPKLIIKVIEGNKGDAVAAVQHNLRYSYGFKTLAVDGIFGKATLAAVKSFQARFKVAVTGQVGARTWNALIVNEK